MVLIMILQLLIAIGLINVWIFRFNKVTEYRGSDAKNMREEFIAYGLPVWLMYLVGIAKVAIAAMLIFSFWIFINEIDKYLDLAKNLLFYNLLALAGLMTGALLMHVKVKDPIKKSYPALSILFMIALIMYSTMN